MENRDFLASKETVQTQAVKPPPDFSGFAPGQNVQVRDQTACDFLNRGLELGYISLVACCHKMRIPVKYMNCIEGGWIECMIDDTLAPSDNDPRVVIKNYTNFIMILGRSDKNLL